MLHGSKAWQSIDHRLATMSDLEIIASLLIVTALCGFVLWEQWRRARMRDSQREPPPCPGKPIEISRLRTALEAARADDMGLHRPAGNAVFHNHLLVLARQTVARMPYFRVHEPPPHPEIPSGPF